MQLHFSLDQLSAFLAVVEEGSFSAAGRRLGRVQSAVSYGIGQLEGGLGTVLFDRSGHTPVLTQQGKRLAAEARLVLAQARDLAECAAQLQEGVESELRIVVDAAYPSERMVDACTVFQEQFPATALRMELGLLRDAVDTVRRSAADLGVCNLAGSQPDDLLVVHLGGVTLLPVCAAHHPLAGHEGALAESALRRSTQIVHTERGRALTEDQGVIAPRTWRVTDLALKTELIVRGLGWGSLPADIAEPLLSSGELVRLHPLPWPRAGHRLELHSVTHPERPLGRAGQWFREVLALEG
jgi:DNA-binding transcriptional LysR family regulator